MYDTASRGADHGGGPNRASAGPGGAGPTWQAVTLEAANTSTAHNPRHLTYFVNNPPPSSDPQFPTRRPFRVHQARVAGHVHLFRAHHPRAAIADGAQPGHTLGR